MSLIVSLRPPLFGSVSASNERRWMSIRWGTSRGLSRREKLLRVTGAALERAKVGDSSGGQRDVDTAQMAAARHNGARRLNLADAAAGPQGPCRAWLRQGFYFSSTVAPASSRSAFSFSASSRSTASRIGLG